MDDLARPQPSSSTRLPGCSFKDSHNQSVIHSGWLPMPPARIHSSGYVHVVTLDGAAEQGAITRGAAQAGQLLDWSALQGFVDPARSYPQRWDRSVADEAFGMNSVGQLEHASALELDELSAAEVDVGRGVEAETRVAVLVVPAKDGLAEGACGLQRAESLGEVRTVLGGIDLCL